MRTADDTLVIGGGTVKVLDATGGEVKVGGSLVQFGGQDLHGEFFTPETYFGAQLASKGEAVLDTMFNHGIPTHDSLKALTARQYPPVTVTKSDSGLMASVILRQREEYEAMLAELAQSGKLGWSSGSAPHTVQKKESGEITRWPLVEASLTPTPAEPKAHAVPLKSLIEEPQQEEEPIINSLKAIRRDLRRAGLTSSIRSLSRTIQGPRPT